MNSRWNSRLLTLGVVIIAGCDSPAVKPGNLAKPTDEQPAAANRLVVRAPRPAQSNDDAETSIQQLLAAHGCPDRATLQTLRNCSVKRVGELNQGGRMSPAESREFYAWPDRYRGDWTYGNAPICSFFIQGNYVRFYAPAAGHAEPLAVSAQETTDALEDLHAFWMTMLVPLADRADYVAEAAPWNDENARATRVWVRDRPACLLVQHAKTHHLQQVIIEKTAEGRHETWNYDLEDLRPVQGVLLPHKLTYKSAHLTGAVWKTIEYAPQNSIEASLFEKP